MVRMMTDITGRVGRVALTLPVAMAGDWDAIEAALTAAIGTGYRLKAETLSQWIRSNAGTTGSVLHAEADITTDDTP